MQVIELPVKRGWKAGTKITYDVQVLGPLLRPWCCLVRFPRSRTCRGAVLVEWDTRRCVEQEGGRG